MTTEVPTIAAKDSTHLDILERICKSNEWINDPDGDHVHMYIYTHAIYETWIIHGTQLEKSLAQQLTDVWAAEIEHMMREAYRKTKNDENRKEQDIYFRDYLYSLKNTHAKHAGLQEAIRKTAYDVLGLRQLIY